MKERREVSCKKCSKLFLKNVSEINRTLNNFCSKSCSNSYSNVNRRKIYESVYCLVCGEIIVDKKNKNRKYCSNKCSGLHVYYEYIRKWKQGLVDGIMGQYGLSAHIKRYLREKYKNKCSACGWAEVNIHTNKVPLEVEHIDGDYKNNKEDNLTLLCPNCHSLTATYKALNNGNGRKKRKQYSLYNKPL